MIRLPLLGLIVIALACVDPNNLPFPSQAAQGLQNKRLELPSRDLQAKVEHIRWAPRHGDLQRTPGEGPRDLSTGVATGMDISWRRHAPTLAPATSSSPAPSSR